MGSEMCIRDRIQVLEAVLLRKEAAEQEELLGNEIVVLQSRLAVAGCQPVKILRIIVGETGRQALVIEASLQIGVEAGRFCPSVSI